MLTSHDSRSLTINKSRGGHKHWKTETPNQTEFFQNFGFGITVFGSVFGLLFVFFGILVQISVRIIFVFGILV